MKQALGMGAGEIVLNSVDRDGTLTGYDLDLIGEASPLSSAPIIALGGGGSLADFRSAIDAGASAVAAGAYFVFQGPHRAVLITYPSPAELRALWSCESSR
jgi:cyclase